MTYDIALPAHQKVFFPPRCVVCETPNPGTIAELKIIIALQQQGLAEELVDAAVGTPRIGSNQRLTITPAVCQQCKQGLKQYHFWKQIWQYLGPFLGVALGVFCLVKNLPVIVALGAILTGVVLPVAYELTYPPAFSVTGIGKNINYEFRSQLCAQEFAELNQKENHPQAD